MPKKIDLDARREQVADAVIDEIVASGLRSVTLARIAARTGLAIGSIRHYFGDTVREVMRFTVGILMQRAVARATALPEEPSERIVEVITFAAPTSEQERKENIALVEYRVMARTDPELAVDIEAISRAAVDTIRALLREALTGRDIDAAALDREALVVFGLIEGFSLSSALSAAPLDESDVRGAVWATVRRMRDAYPSAGVEAT